MSLFRNNKEFSLFSEKIRAVREERL